MKTYVIYQTLTEVYHIKAESEEQALELFEDGDKIPVFIQNHETEVWDSFDN